MWLALQTKPFPVCPLCNRIMGPNHYAICPALRRMPPFPSRPKPPVDFRPRPLYPLQRPKYHKAWSKAVTISIGFCAEEAIVLAADREITSSLGTKYQRKKVFPHYAPDFALGISYAGYCDVFDDIHEKIKTEIDNRFWQHAATFQSTTELIEKILRDARKKYGIKKLPSLLLAISIGPEARLYKSEEAGVSPAGSWKVFGYGDSPLTHYLVETLTKSSRDIFDQHVAMLLASYVVIQAGEYTFGCHGGPDILLIQKHGVIEQLREAPPESLKRSLNSLTQEIAEMWGELCELTNNREVFLSRMVRLSKRLDKIRERLRAIPRAKISAAIPATGKP